MNRTFPSTLRFAHRILRGTLVVVFLGLPLLILQGWLARPPRVVSFSGRAYSLEVADTAPARTRGLGERDSLCASCAMLFVFAKPGEYPFWMGGMRFSIDIVWLLEDRVVHIERSLPWEDTETVYYPGVLADRVLELNAGDATSLEIGSTITFFP